MASTSAAKGGGALRAAALCSRRSLGPVTHAPLATKAGAVIFPFYDRNLKLALRGITLESHFRAPNVYALCVTISKEYSVLVTLSPVCQSAPLAWL